MRNTGMSAKDKLEALKNMREEQPKVVQYKENQGSNSNKDESIFNLASKPKQVEVPATEQLKDKSVEELEAILNNYKKD